MFTRSGVAGSNKFSRARAARAQLPAMLEQFRKEGADVVIGARRKPEAVVLSYERYLQLAGGRERVREMLERWVESGGGLSEDEAMKLATEVAGAVAYSRVHVGVHYPSDVAAGVAIGLASGLLATYIHWGQRANARAE